MDILSQRYALPHCSPLGKKLRGILCMSVPWSICDCSTTECTMAFYSLFLPVAFFLSGGNTIRYICMCMNVYVYMYIYLYIICVCVYIYNMCMYI
jgi:hypothetical protein